MKTDLTSEIQTLRDQLSEADDIRRAIMRAEVDGFVVGEGDDDRYVHLLSGAYAREVAERQRRHRETDEHTRRFLSLLAIELLTMLKTMRGSLELLKREVAAGDCQDAVEALEGQANTLQRLAEDLRKVNPKD